MAIETVPIEFVFLKELPKSLKCQDENDKVVFIPKAVLHRTPAVPRAGEIIRIDIPEWLAIEEGWV